EQELDALMKALGTSDRFHCLLTASSQTLNTRLSEREHGASRRHHILRANELRQSLLKAFIADLELDTTDLCPDTLAEMVLSAQREID
ncbi:MAG: hypothetical protein AAFN80_15660, partial [Pseudomonadota bacterium]